MGTTLVKYPYTQESHQQHLSAQPPWSIGLLVYWSYSKTRKQSISPEPPVKCEYDSKYLIVSVFD